MKEKELDRVNEFALVVGHMLGMISSPDIQQLLKEKGFDEEHRETFKDALMIMARKVFY